MPKRARESRAAAPRFALAAGFGYPAAMGLAQRLRATVYDRAIVPMTIGWYRAVLDDLPEGCRLLDVGIGTGAALVANRDSLGRKDIHVVGVDIDADYIARCREAITGADLGSHVEARLESIYDHRGGPYDAVYFSASFMLLPDPGRALRHVATLLAPPGRIYFTQTFEHERSALVAAAKPLLRWVTTIDFGRVTYEDDFRAALRGGGVTIAAWRTLHAGKRRSAVWVSARPTAAQ